MFAAFPASDLAGIASQVVFVTGKAARIAMPAAWMRTPAALLTMLAALIPAKAAPLRMKTAPIVPLAAFWPLTVTYFPQREEFCSGRAGGEAISPAT